MFSNINCIRICMTQRSLNSGDSSSRSSMKPAGSVALFADWFRYRLPHERGGIWTGADLVCVRPYDNWRRRLRKWQRRTLLGDRRDRIRWGEYGPKGLIKALRHFGLIDQALSPGHFNPVSFPEWKRIFSAGQGESLLQAETRAVHLYNNAFREWPGFDKNGRFPEDSLFESLCRKYLPADGCGAARQSSGSSSASGCNAGPPGDCCDSLAGPRDAPIESTATRVSYSGNT